MWHKHTIELHRKEKGTWQYMLKLEPGQRLLQYNLKNKILLKSA
jgi:hypothetical protein